MPWQLYQSSLPRKSPKQSPSKRNSADGRLIELAQSSLSRQEKFYLFLTVASPLVGALFLQHVIAALGAAESLSWFSTTLFVLATGVRPWSHLVSRLRARSRLLHDAVHYPSEHSNSHHRLETDRVIAKLVARVDELQGELKDTRARLEKVEVLKDVCDDLSEALDEAQRSSRRGERRAEATKNAMVVRVEALEARLVLLEQRPQQSGPEPSRLATHYEVLHRYLTQGTHALLKVSQAIWLLGVASPVPTKERRPSQSQSQPQSGILRQANGDVSPSLKLKTNGSANTLKSPLRSPERERLALGAPRLATIVETGHSDLDADLDGDADVYADSDGTYVSDKEAAATFSPQSPLRTYRIRTGRNSWANGKGRAKAGIRTYGERIFDCVECLALWPYRASVRILVILMAPVRRYLS